MQDLEKLILKSEKIDFKKNFLIMEEMCRYACKTRKLPVKTSVKDIKHLIRYAKAINSVWKTSELHSFRT